MGNQDPKIAQHASLVSLVKPSFSLHSVTGTQHRITRGQDPDAKQVTEKTKEENLHKKVFQTMPVYVVGRGGISRCMTARTEQALNSPCTRPFRSCGQSLTAQCSLGGAVTTTNMVLIPAHQRLECRCKKLTLYTLWHSIVQQDTALYTLWHGILPLYTHILHTPHTPHTHILWHGIALCGTTFHALFRLGAEVKSFLERHRTS